MQMGENRTIRATHDSVSHHAHIRLQAGNVSFGSEHRESKRGGLVFNQALIVFKRHVSPPHQWTKFLANLHGLTVGQAKMPRVVSVQRERLAGIPNGLWS